MKSIAFKPTMPAVITRFTTAALLLLALAACNSGGGGGGGSAPITGKSDSLTPTELVATGFYQGIDLTWKQAKGADSYTVYYRAGGSFKKTTEVGVESKKGIRTTNASITGLENGTEYYLRVEANSAAGNYLSKIVTATTNLQPPTELSAAGVYKGVELSWKEAIGATSYTVYYSDASFDSSTASGVQKQADITTTKASITKLDNGTEYYLRVKAVNAEAKVETKLSEQVDATADAQAPNLRATVAYQAIDLSWDAVKYAIGYIVYYHTAKIDSTTVSAAKSITVDNPKITKTGITGLTNGKTYYLRAVTKYSTKDNSGFSKEVIVTATATTQSPILRATGVNRGVDLSWDSITGADSYTVYYHTASFDKTSDSGVDSTTDIKATNISITDLTNDTKYYLRAVTKYSVGVVSDLSEQVEATADLPPPTKLKAIGVNLAVDLSWDAVEGATSYTVYYHTASFDSITKEVKSQIDITADNTIITGLTNGIPYYFRVKAISADGESKLSKEVEATPIRLEPPTKLKATGVYQGIELSWEAVTGATSYTVYYSDASFDSSTTDSGVDSTTDMTTNTSISITDLTNDIPYYLRVKAIKGNEETELSEQVAATPAAQAPKLRATGAYQAIEISWDAVTHATGYTVYYREDSGFDSTSDSTTDSVIQSKTVTAPATSITDLTNDTKYYLRAVTNYQEGVSHLSEQVEATADLQPPTNLEATGVNQQVHLRWKGSKEAASYNVYYHTASFDSTGNGVQKRLGITTTELTITGLNNNETYYFRVKAIKGNEESKLSEQVSATPTTKLSAPSAVVAASNSPATVDLTWNAIKGVTRYDIYYAKQTLDVVSYSNYATVGGGLETTTNASITISDLSIDTTYYFVVVADYNKLERAAPEVSTKTSYIAELAVGGFHACVRLNTGSRIKCWGSNNDGLSDVFDISAKQISTGNVHSCAIDLSDDLYCWGSNHNSQLGPPSGSSKKPRRTIQDEFAKVSLVRAGYMSTCVLAGGNNYCWGSRERGGLGDNVVARFSTYIAQKIKDITPDVKQFALGSQSGCAIDASDDLWCWGYNKYGQAGDGTNENRLRPVHPLLQGKSKATMVDAVKYHYCVVDDATKIQCWGANSDGQLGIGSKSNSNIPQYVITSDSTTDHLTGVSKVATGHEHSCAIIKDGSADSDAGGKVRCWGESKYGRIGTSTDDTVDREIAGTTDIPGIDNAIDIAAGNNFTCVLLEDRVKVKCWGRNKHGQLGRSSATKSSATPLEVQGL